MRSTHTNIINVLAKGESQGEKEVYGEEAIYDYYDYSTLLAQYESEENEEKEAYVPKIAEAAMHFKSLIAYCLHNIDAKKAIDLNNVIDQALNIAYRCSSRQLLAQMLPELNGIIIKVKQDMLAEVKKAGKQSAKDLINIQECAEVISSHLSIELNKLDEVRSYNFNTGQSPNYSEEEKPVGEEAILAEYSVPPLLEKVAELLKPYTTSHASRTKYDAKKQNQLNQAYLAVNGMMAMMMKKAQEQQAQKEKGSNQSSHTSRRRHK